MTEGVDEVVVRGEHVTKVHAGPDGADRAARAALATRAAADAGVPVPRVLARRGPRLVTSRLAGRRGQEVLEEDAPAVLRAIGLVARRLRRHRPPTGLPVVDAAGTWVHGDLCPANLLLTPDGGLAGVVDWVDSRVDDPLVDVVWTEWLVRTHHPAAAPALPALWRAAELPRPSAAGRRAAMARVLRHRLAVEPPAAAATWRGHLASLPALDLA